MLLDKAQKVMACLKWVSDDRGLTLEDLSFRTGMNGEEVKEVLALLQDSSIFSVYVEEGPGGEPRYNAYSTRGHIPLLDFTPEELYYLYKVLSLATESNPTEKEMADYITNKMTKTYTRPPLVPVYKGMGPMSKVVHPGPLDPARRHLAFLERALLEEHQVNFVYQGREKVARWVYRVCPLGLVFHRDQGYWYLLACRRETIRRRPLHPQFYRLDRMVKLEHGGRHFQYPEDFQLHQYLKPFWGIQRGRTVKVKVRFINEAGVVSKARRELENFGGGTIELEGGGDLVFTGELVGEDDFRTWLRGFGSSVEVLEPPELREKMIEGARGLYEMYKDSGGEA